MGRLRDMQELEERAAGQVVRALGARRWIRRDLGGVQMRDFDIEFEDEHKEPLEVTLDAEAGVVQTWERIDRQQFDPVDLQRRWLVGPELRTNEHGRVEAMDVTFVRRELESILLELEHAGYESFDTSQLMYGPSRRPELGRRLMAIGVHHGFSSEADPNRDDVPRLWIVKLENDSESWETLSGKNILGISLERLFGLGMLFGVGSSKNDGHFNLNWYQQPNFVQLSDLIPPEEAKHAMETLFGASLEELRGLLRPVDHRGIERLAFNPLQVRPFIRMSETFYLAPVPTFVFWRATAPALYYIALERLVDEAAKRSFTDDIGTLFEDYVLRQAVQLRGATPPVEVYKAIEYRKGAFTTDVILVLPDHVLLIEAKASRLTEASRMGGPTLRPEIERTIGRAEAQIEVTAELIASRAPALVHIPADRPVYGLVITLEPYHVVGFEETKRERRSVPIGIGSISDLERFIAVSLSELGSVDDIAAQVNESGHGWNLSRLLESSDDQRFANPLLDAELDHLMTSVFGASGPVDMGGQE